jgi:DNA-binding MarR family transcriptional regulator
MQNKNIAISFSDYQVPEFKEVRGFDYIRFGTDNKYPEYLLEMYNKSPKHGAIIDGKVGYVTGNGFEEQENLKEVNSFKESGNDLLCKQALDLEIFNGFFTQVIWDRAGRIKELIHLDYHKVRSNEDNTVFYYREKGWDNYKRDDYEVYPAFNPAKPKGSQVLYFKEYRPGLNTYTLPSYISALNYIEADYLVSEHVLNNAKTGFTASKMINFFNGSPETEEQKKEIEKGLKEKYTGKKGSKLIISFNDDPAKVPQVLDLGSSDMSKENFEPIDTLIQQNIFTAHKVTSPMLFGIKTPGQLGGRSELMEAWELMKNTQINKKQQQIERVWNVLQALRGGQDVKITPTQPVGYDILNNSKVLDMLPEAYIFELLGIDISKYPEYEAEKAAKQAEAHAKLNPPQQPPAKEDQKFSDDDLLISCFSEMGSPKSEYEIVKKKITRFCEEEERLEFAEITRQEANILEQIRKDKRITPDTLAKVYNLPVVYVERLIEGLVQRGLLTEKEEEIGDDVQVERNLTPEAPAAVEEYTPPDIFIKYSYEGPQDDRNRDFCARMMELDRLYSRSEIEQISQRVGYSVWERRGGFWQHKDGEITPYCRHKWMQNVVIKRKNG